MLRNALNAGPGGMAQQVNCLLQKPDDLTLFLGAHTKIDGENYFYKVVLSLPQVCHGMFIEHIHIHIKQIKL